MDLKDVVANSQVTSAEALLAFNAGHHDKAEQNLMAQMIETGKYFEEKAMPAGDVTESANGDTPDTGLAETRAEDPGAVLPATQFGPAAAAQQIGGSLTDEKPTQ